MAAFSNQTAATQGQPKNPPTVFDMLCILVLVRGWICCFSRHTGIDWRMETKGAFSGRGRAKHSV
jgi:hypothetical protein